MKKVWPKYAILFSVVLIIGIGYLYTYFTTIELKNEFIMKDLEKRGFKQVEIQKVMKNRDDEFIVFTYNKNKDENIGMIYYEPNFFIKNRYTVLGASWQSYKYGKRVFGQGCKYDLALD